jgi:hypothetical protein
LAGKEDTRKREGRLLLAIDRMGTAALWGRDIRRWVVVIVLLVLLV